MCFLSFHDDIPTPDEYDGGPGKAPAPKQEFPRNHQGSARILTERLTIIRQLRGVSIMLVSPFFLASRHRSRTAQTGR